VENQDFIITWTLIKYSMAYLSGFHAIEEQIKSGKAVGPLLVAKAGPRARELVALALSRKIPVNRTGTAGQDCIAPDHRGIVLKVEEVISSGNELSLDAFIAGLNPADGSARKNALVLVLDEITDPHNYGAILRSCDQFAADLVISQRRRTAKHAAVIAQTSAGASAWVPSVEIPNLRAAVNSLKKAGFWIYGASMEGEPVYRKDLRGRVAIVLGSEGGGISRLLQESCDAMIGIPSLGRLDSLNVSVAAGILLYEVNRQRKI
jgi:23S rRNA (guanosine2251-2'-O)-methyltransferase